MNNSPRSLAAVAAAIVLADGKSCENLEAALELLVVVKMLVPELVVEPLQLYKDGAVIEVAAVVGELMDCSGQALLWWERR